MFYLFYYKIIINKKYLSINKLTYKYHFETII